MTLELDVAEDRIKQPEQIILIGGHDWDLGSITSDSDIYLDDVTQTLMLRPLPLTSEWQTSATGAYARYRLVDTDRAGHADWIEFERGFSGNYFYHNLNPASAARRITTTDTLPKNCPVYVSFWAYNYGGDRQVRLEAGWGAPGSGVSIRLWSDKQLEIWKATDYLHTVQLSSRSAVSTRATTDETLQDMQVELLLIPCRRRALLILSNMGGGAVYEFEDLSQEAPDNTITPAGTFWALVPSGTITLQMARCRFRESGIAFSTLREFLYAPASGSTITNLVYADAPGFGTSSVNGALYTSDGTAVFNPDGVATQCRVRISLTGDGFSTRFVYGASSQIERRLQAVPDAAKSVPYPFVWRVGTEPGSVGITVNGFNPGGLGLEHFTSVGNRSVRLRSGNTVYLRGRSLPVEFEHRVADQAEPFNIEIRDWWYVLETQIIRESIPLDGLELSEAIRILVKSAGFKDSDLDLTNTGFNLPTMSASSQGEWSVLPRSGETYAEAIENLWRTYARTWFLGWRPTAAGYRLVFEPPPSTPYTVAAVLYRSRTEAIAGGISESQIWKHIIYRGLQESSIAPECNEIIVTGWDPQRRIPFRRSWRDDSSQDATLLPGDRPDNWLGEPQAVGIVDYTITTIDAADRVIDILMERLAKRRRRLTFESQLQYHQATGLPVWVNEIFRIGDELWKVVHFDCRTRKESSVASSLRTRYEVEYLGQVTI